MSSGLMVIMSLLPGIPMLPFLGIAGVTGYGAFHLWRTREDAKVAAVQAEETASAAPPPEEPIGSARQERKSTRLNSRTYCAYHLPPSVRKKNKKKLLRLNTNRQI